MKRVCGLMLFCFGLGMAVLFFVPETIFTFFFVIGCLILGIIYFAVRPVIHSCLWPEQM